MADYILIRKSRNILSSVLHVVFNLLLSIGSIALTVITGSFLLGIILVLISKWRVFAVRPRYWLLNLKSSIVDFTVGVSFVLIAYCSGTTVLPVHFILAVLYASWLIFLKPRSSILAAKAQAIVAIFLGTTAVTLMTANADSVFMLLPCFVIGYGAARHVLVQSEDHDYTIITFIAGLLFAEIAWLCHSWLIVYKFSSLGIILPQLSIILSILAFAVNSVYESAVKNDGKAKAADVMMPVIFSILLIAIIVIWFSRPAFYLVK